ncbi:hypothetical protein F5Y06DRAFT_299465 [Hypoxylon sp. FL0890]|nr:hypothetical protein F5Y06DRAFT_299465 [Hypoxylon sp. FL0890]
MAKQLNSWQLDISAFKKYKATGRVYTVESETTKCLLCQDYQEIDEFAKLVSLDKLNKLKVPDPLAIPPVSKTDVTIFDASTLFVVLYTFCGGFGAPGSLAHDDLASLKKYKGATFEKLWYHFDFDDKQLDVYWKEKSRLQADFIQLASAIEALEKQVEAEDDKTVIKKHDAAIEEARAKFDAVQQKINSMRESANAHNPFYIDRGGIILEELGRVFWEQFLNARGHSYEHMTPKEIENIRQDPVARARLMYAWLACSVEYDWGLARDIVRSKFIGPNDSARWGNMLVKGKEVCEWYSKAFVRMFSGSAAMRPDEDAKKHQDRHAKYISGWSRSAEGGGVQTDKHSWGSKEQKDTPKHAWTAFRLNPGSPLATAQFKIIDPTWAVPIFGGPWEPLAWSQRNSSFAWDHIPEKREDLFPLPGDGPVPMLNVLYETARSTFPEEGRGFLRFIDKSSLNQKDAAALATNGTIEVTFECPCVHMQGHARDSKFQLVAVERTLLSRVPWIKIKPVTSAPFQCGGNMFKASLDVKAVPTQADVYILATSEKKRVVAWNFDKS